MSSGGGMPPLPPLTAPKQTANSPMAAELESAGRRAGLRAAIMNKMKQGGTKAPGGATKLSGGQ